ncbi:MAG: hypothetical protein DHS20C17_34540 [Cyclobacteriaceae bacterium]|nr:MAG: hypothetical protein DHS20C17_34540 [Cyclobacteriaceae bacterium]
MSWIRTPARILVGGLFIFSGLIKVNDPVGTAIKLEEYFTVFSSDIAAFFAVFEPFSLQLSVLLVVLEVVLGVAVLINYRMPVTTWVLLLLILFFSFLTFYSAYFNKVTDCGCFGDAIKLTPWESFTKDIILLVLILMIFPYRNQFTPLLKGRPADLLMVVIIAANTFLAIYAIRHLPFVDFRAYKPGASIPAGMEPSEPLRHIYIMEKDGERFEFETYPSDTTYKYLDIKLLNPEAQPTITDYSVWSTDGEDITEQSLQGKQLIIIVHYVEKADISAFQKINKLIDEVAGEVNVMVLTASDEQAFEAFRHEVQLGAPYYFADATVLKTMVRSNPGVLVLKDGVVLDKWHYRDVPSPERVRQLIN